MSEDKWEYTGLGRFTIVDGNGYQRDAFKVETVRGDKVGLFTKERYAEQAVRDHNERNALEAERDRLREALDGIRQLIRDVDLLATKETDSEGWIVSYRFNTGAWHRLLGVVNGAELPAYIQQEARMKVEIVPIAALNPDAATPSSATGRPRVHLRPDGHHENCGWIDTLWCCAPSCPIQLNVKGQASATGSEEA